MSGWSCPHDVNGICDKVQGAYCRPGMKGCILHGQVTFQDGIVPSPVWSPGHVLGRDVRPPESEEPPSGERRDH